MVSIKPNPTQPAVSRKYALQLEDLSEELLCDALVISPDYVQHDVHFPATSESDALSLLRCIAIIDKPISFPTSPVVSHDVDGALNSAEPVTDNFDTFPEVDTAVLVFPPSSLPTGSPTTSVSVLITGEGSMAAPRGKCKS